MGGCFSIGRFRFQVESTDWVLGLRESLDDDHFESRLARRGQIPDLGGAPIASWLLARLGRMTDDGLGVPLHGKERIDGGGWVTEFVVYVEPEQPVATFQFQANMEGAAVLGDRASDFPAEEILAALAAAIMEAPDALAECRLAVIDPEWRLDPEIYHPHPVKGSRNWYGWDGFQFLGKDNIRDAPLK